jgi:hypothetical protein
MKNHIGVNDALHYRDQHHPIFADSTERIRGEIDRWWPEWECRWREWYQFPF